MYFFMNVLIHISSNLLINQFLTLVIISIWFKEREAFNIILYHHFYSILYKLPRLGLSKLYFYYGKKFQLPQIIMLNRIGKGGNLCFVPSYWEKAFSQPLCEVWYLILKYSFHPISELLSSPHFLKVFHLKWLMDFVKCFLCVY